MKLSMYSFIILLFFAIENVVSSPAINLHLCESNDDACVTNAVKKAYPQVLEANQEIGAEDLDPMFLPLIEGNLSILKFKLFNTTVDGYKSCAVQSAKYEEEQQTLRVEFLCPGFTLKGLYDINGRLIILPVQGNGDYELIAKKYRVSADIGLKIVTGTDGKEYRTIKNFKVVPEPLENVHFDFRNLFNGQKDLADGVLKFANESWKEVAYEVQGPVFEAVMKKIVKNANKYLKTLSIDKYLVQ